MKWGAVPLGAMVRTGRMDAEFFLGDSQKAAIASAERAVEVATRRLAMLRAKRADEERRRMALGIEIHVGSSGGGGGCG